MLQQRQSTPMVEAVVSQVKLELIVLYVTLQLVVTWIANWFKFRIPSMKAKLVEQARIRARMPDKYGPNGAGSSIEYWQVCAA